MSLSISLLGTCRSGSWPPTFQMYSHFKRCQTKNHLVSFQYINQNGLEAAWYQNEYLPRLPPSQRVYWGRMRGGEYDIPHTHYAKRRRPKYDRYTSLRYYALLMFFMSLIMGSVLAVSVYFAGK